MDRCCGPCKKPSRNKSVKSERRSEQRHSSLKPKRRAARRTSRAGKAGTGSGSRRTGPWLGSGISEFGILWAEHFSKMQHDLRKMVNLKRLENCKVRT